MFNFKYVIAGFPQHLNSGRAIVPNFGTVARALLASFDFTSNNSIIRNRGRSFFYFKD
jgi:hypothetical protein